MPKISSKKSKVTSLHISSPKYFSQRTLLVGDMGLKLQELEVTFKSMEHIILSQRGTIISQIIKKTPNLKKLTLTFSGHLHSYADALGTPLMDALCVLTHLEEFYHRGVSVARRTEFGFHNLMRLVSSWPKLRVLHVAGDLETTEDSSHLPPVICSLQHATFESCTGKFEDLARLFVASGKSLKTFEAWAMGTDKIDVVLAQILPSVESIKIGGCSHPSPAFLRTQLGTARNLHTFHLGGAYDRSGRLRSALAEALVAPAPALAPSFPPSDTTSPTRTRPARAAKRKTVPRPREPEFQFFPALRHLAYPAAGDSATTGKENESAWEHIGEEALRAAAAARGVSAVRARDLEYRADNTARTAALKRWNRAAGW